MHFDGCNFYLKNGKNSNKAGVWEVGGGVDEIGMIKYRKLLKLGLVWMGFIHSILIPLYMCKVFHNYKFFKKH